MNSKIKITTLLLVIMISFFSIGCKNKTDEASKAEDTVKVENTKEINGEVFLKRVNDLTMQGLLKFYKVDPNEEVQSKYVLYWDPMRQEVNEAEGLVDFDKGKLPVFAHAFNDIGFTAEDVMYPDNIRLKQLVAQKIRKEYVKYITEDDILARVDRMNMSEVKPSEEEASQEGFNEEDWYIQGAIERIMTEASGERITGVVKLIKPYAELYVLKEMAPEKFEGVFKERFGKSMSHKEMENLLELSEYYINGKFRVEEIKAYAINDPSAGN